MTLFLIFNKKRIKKFCPVIKNHIESEKGSLRFSVDLYIINLRAKK